MPGLCRADLPRWVSNISALRTDQGDADNTPVMAEKWGHSAPTGLLWQHRGDGTVWPQTLAKGMALIQLSYRGWDIGKTVCWTLKRHFSLLFMVLNWKQQTNGNFSGFVSPFVPTSSHLALNKHEYKSCIFFWAVICNQSKQRTQERWRKVRYISKKKWVIDFIDWSVNFWHCNKVLFICIQKTQLHRYISF